MRWVVGLILWAAVVSDGQDGPATNPTVRNANTPKGPTSSPLTPTAPSPPPVEVSEEEKVIQRWAAFQKLSSTMVEGVIRQALPRLTRMNGEVDISPECMSGVLKLVVGLKGLKSWAVRMLDASGKLPPGLLDGSISDLGNFDQCLAIRLNDNFDGHELLRGQHCAVNIVPALPPKERQVTFRSNVVDLVNVTEKDSVFMDFSNKAPFFYRILIRIGACVPSVCSREDLHGMLQEVLKDTMFNGSVAFCQTNDDDWQIDYVQISVMCILGVILFLVLFGTWVEWSWPGDSKDDTVPPSEWLEWFLAFFRCFSARRNAEMLMNTESGGQKLGAMDGIRVLSMLWIILVHTYAFQHHNAIGKIMEIIEFSGNISFSVVVNAWVSVDSFFFLGGVLVAYSTLRTMDRNGGQLRLLRFILRRIWRLFPCLALAQGLLFLLPLLDRGPSWPETIGDEIEKCRSMWWGSLFFLNSWFPFQKMCMVHTWYVSSDFQLFVLASLPIYLLYRWPRAGVVCCLLFVLASVGVVFAITYFMHLYPTIMFLSPDVDQMNEIGSWVYLKPYTHLAPYAIGILVGYVIVKYRNIKFNPFLSVLCWVASLSLLMVVLIGCFHWHNGYNASKLMSALYGSLHRAAWGLALAWITFACVTGHGGLINHFLSWRLFTPLGRLTYLMYLIHMVGIWQRNASRRERFYLRHYDMIYEFFGNMVLAISLASVLHILVEAPFANLDKLIFPVHNQTAPVKTPATSKTEIKNEHQNRSTSRNGQVKDYTKNGLSSSHL